MGNPRLLIVENHVATRNLLQAIFQGEGWEVSTVGTVAEGLARLDPVPAGLILDMDLPDGGGETVLQRVRDDGLPTRVAVCTGLCDTDRRAKVERLSPDAFLMKPIDIDDLFTALGSA
jgi:DNA-binding response OmpR family regulator